MSTTFALEFKTAFLFEKRSEPYKRYGEVSIAEEKAVLDQETELFFWLCQESEQGGAKL
ncbi:MAG: hypothetical protein AAB914_00810 [Patescibacteria group bacterium]